MPRITRDQIDKVTFGIGSLDYKEREAVRDALYDLKKRKGGTFTKSQLQIELRKLRKDHVISDIDRRNLEDAFFDR